MRNFFKVTVLAALLVGMIVPVARAQFFFMEHPLVGKKAPDFELDNMEAQKQSFSKMTANKNAILFFWATWCPHCREQINELSSKKEQLKTDGIVLTLVDLGEDPQLVQSYLEKNKLDFSVLLDTAGTVAEDYKVMGIPTFVFVDKAGTVRGVENGIGDDYPNYFKEEVKK